MTRAVRGRRLASPVRVTLALGLGGDLDGAWWPRKPPPRSADELLS